MYYTSLKDSIISGDSIAGVVRQIPKRPAFNRRFIERYLTGGVYFFAPNDNQTVFEGIYRVEAPPRISSSSEALPKSDQEALAHFHDKLLTATQRCIANAKHPAAELSGGLDSSATSTYLRLLRPHEALDAFTNVPLNRVPTSLKSLSYDESAYAKRVARTLKMRHHLINSGFHFHDIIEKYTEVLGSFAETSLLLLNHRCYELAQELGVDVLLSGYGGDEMVSQHASLYASELKLAGKKWQARYERARAMDLQDWFRYFRILSPKPSLFEPNPAHSAILKIPIPKVEPPKSKRVTEHESLMVEGAFSRHFSQRIAESKIVASHFGIRKEYPLADIELMRYFHALPAHFKRRHGVGRLLMRQALAPHLPRSVVWRHNKDGSAVSGALCAYIQQLPQLFCERITPDHKGLLADYIDFKALTRFVENFDARQSGMLRLCNMVMMFAHLEKLGTT